MKPNYENLVIKGGGMRGYAYPFALQILKDNGYLGGIKRIAGTSAGSILAAFLAVGVKIEDLPEIMGVDFSRFEDDSLGNIRDAYRLYSRFGFCPGVVCEDWIKDTIGNISGNSEITFKEAFEKTGLELRVVTTNISKGEVEIFSSLLTPDIKVYKAVRMSMAIPLFFVPVIQNDDYYVDGGVLCNYYSFPVEEGETLGLYLQGNNDYKPGKDKKIKDFTTYVACVFETMLYQLEKSYVNSKLWDNSVIIDTGDIKATDFNLSEDLKAMLRNNAIIATNKFMERFK